MVGLSHEEQPWAVPPAGANKKTVKKPNLANATPAMLVDELGEIKRHASHLKTMEEYYKASLHAKRGDETEVKGERFTAQVSTQTQHRLDNDKVREVLTDDQLETCTKAIEITQVRVTERKDKGAIEE